MYGQVSYGLLKYAQEGDLGGSMPDGHFVDLARYAPPYFRRVRELAALWKAEGYEIGLLQYHLRDLAEQAFIPTATWGLALWEEMYGVSTNLALSYEDRREILYAKLRGQGTTTRVMIKQTAEAFSGGEVDVIEDNANHLFIVRFVGIKGIPQNMNAFVTMLEDIKPAHLAYRFEYRYTIWGDLVGKLWSGYVGKSWAEIRTMMEDE